MKYTQAGAKADQLIQSYLDVIIPVILNNIPLVLSIILGGGAGRGEGSVGIQNGKLTPQNDLELFLITDGPVDEDVINQTANLAIKKLDLPQTGATFYEFKHKVFANTFYIDMKVIPVAKLPHLLPMFRYYELKYASQVVWGKHGLMYLGSKALTDLPGALTQLSGRYTPTYRSRIKTLEETFQKDFPDLADNYPQIVQVAKEGLEFKLKPDFSSRVKPGVLWRKQKKYIRAVLIHFMGEFYKTKLHDVDDAAEFLYKYGYTTYYHPYLDWTLSRRFRLPKFGKVLVFPLIFALNLLFFWRMFAKQGKLYLRILLHTRAPDLTMFTSMLYLLYAADGRGKINKEYLVKARKYLAKTYPLTRTKTQNTLILWEETRQDFADAFVLFSLMKIV